MNLVMEVTMVKEDFAALAKKEYDELNKQKTDLLGQVAEIDKKMKPLVAYMQAAGLVKPGKKRGRKAKGEAAA